MYVRKAHAMVLHRIQRRKDAEGFTLLEILITLSIISIGLLGLIPLMTIAAQANATARHFSEAHGLAQAKMEKLKLAKSYAVPRGLTLAGNNQTLIKDNEIIDGVVNTLTSPSGSADFVETDLDSTSATMVAGQPGTRYTRYWNVVDDIVDNSGTTVPFMKALRVAVTWQENGHTREVSYTSLIGVKELQYY